MQDVVAALEVARALDGHEVVRLLHDADDAVATAPGSRAGRADLAVGDGVADRAGARMPPAARPPRRRGAPRRPASPSGGGRRSAAPTWARCRAAAAARRSAASAAPDGPPEEFSRARPELTRARPAGGRAPRASRSWAVSAPIEREEHVPLRVPGVALRPQERGGRFPGGHRRPPFDELVARADGQAHAGHEEEEPAARGAAASSGAGSRGPGSRARSPARNARGGRSGCGPGRARPSPRSRAGPRRRCSARRASGSARARRSAGRRAASAGTAVASPSRTGTAMKIGAVSSNQVK